MKATGQNEIVRRPIGITALGGFFVFGTLASGLAVLLLIFPGGPLEPVWHINPRGHEGFVRMGGWAFVLLVPVCLACAVTALGLFQGRRWGYRLAITLLLLNLTGDVVNVAMGSERRAILGLPVAALLLWYLRSSSVKSFFSTT